MNLKIFSDGGARGNPGPAGFGVVVLDENHNPIYLCGEFLGIKTNNEAEYAGLLHALTWLEQNQNHLNPSLVTFTSDSQLLLRQIQGKYKVKAPHLKLLYNQARSLLEKINCPLVFSEVLRENNQLADALANRAMDLKSTIHELT